jgi:hypothetical protein
VPTGRHDIATLSHVRVSETMFFFAIAHPPQQPFCTKQGSSVKNCGVFATLVGPTATLSHEMRFECQKTDVFFCD